MHTSSHVAANTKHFRPGFRKTSSMLEVDDEGGRMFLRVLIHLTMHDYPPLISGSLQLLFKHFSQRQEVLHTFKQVTPEHLGAGPGWGGCTRWPLCLEEGSGCPKPAAQGSPRKCHCRFSS